MALSPGELNSQTGPCLRHLDALKVSVQTVRKPSEVNELLILFTVFPNLGPNVLPESDSSTGTEEPAVAQVSLHNVKSADPIYKQLCFGSEFLEEINTIFTFQLYECACRVFPRLCISYYLYEHIYFKPNFKFRYNK